MTGVPARAAKADGMRRGGWVRLDTRLGGVRLFSGAFGFVLQKKSVSEAGVDERGRFALPEVAGFRVIVTTPEWTWAVRRRGGTAVCGWE